MRWFVEFHSFVRKLHLVVFSYGQTHTNDILLHTVRPTGNGLVREKHIIKTRRPLSAAIMVLIRVVLMLDSPQRYFIVGVRNYHRGLWRVFWVITFLQVTSRLDLNVLLDVSAIQSEEKIGVVLKFSHVHRDRKYREYIFEDNSQCEVSEKWSLYFHINFVVNLISLVLIRTRWRNPVNVC